MPSRSLSYEKSADFNAFSRTECFFLLKFAFSGVHTRRTPTRLLVSSSTCLLVYLFTRLLVYLFTRLLVY